MIHPTLKIIGFMLVKQAFLIVALFRHGAARGSTKRDPRAPRAPPREPQGAPRLPQGAPMDGIWMPFGSLFGPNLVKSHLGDPKIAKSMLKVLEGIAFLKTTFKNPQFPTKNGPLPT